MTPISWVIVAVMLIYVLITLLDINLRRRLHEDETDNTLHDPVEESDHSSPYIYVDRSAEAELPPPVIPAESLRQAEAYDMDEIDRSTEAETETADVHDHLPVIKDLIPETENIDLDCFMFFKGARILVVEDNLVNQKIIQNVLRRSGMQIDIAENGEMALEYLFKEHRKYDLVLMDISMPVMDGITATKIIRRASRFTGLPIIAFTAFSLGDEIETMFKAGANAYLTKPLDIKQLYTVFSLFIGNVNRGLSMEKMLQMQGLDTEKGLAEAEGDTLLYKHRLESFVERYVSSIELIPQWIKEKQYERVRLECKEMLPVLSQIGAYEMQKMVQEMQIQFIYHNEHLLDKFALLFRAHMQALVDTINVYLEQPETEPAI